MVFAAEFGTGQVLWSILWFMLFVMWISLVISIFGDIIRTPSLSGWGKATWLAGVIFMPFLGVLLYLIVNGDKMGRRADERARSDEVGSTEAAGRAYQEAGQAYSSEAGGTTRPRYNVWESVEGSADRD